MAILEDKVAIVTGSARGIGRATAELLVENGAKVLINDIDGDVAEQAASEISGDTLVFSGDLTKEGVPDRLVQKVIDEWGKVDILVNNAGYTLDAPIHKMSDDWFQKMLDIHTVVPFRMCRAVAPHMREPAKAERERGEERFRKVVNVLSLAGIMGNAGQVAYAAAKGGCFGLTRSLAKEWGAFKICVNAVAFGFIETRLTADLPDSARAGFAAAIPVGRGGTPEEAARGVYFLCSPGSDYVTGQVLNVSGGLTVGMGS